MDAFFSRAGLSRLAALAAVVEPRAAQTSDTLGAASRFAGLPVWAARLVLLAFAAAMAASLAASFGPAPAPAFVATHSDEGDAALYRRIAERVQDGEGYYAAASAELRARGYPLRPALAFRPPTLTLLLAWLGSDTARLLVIRLLAGAVLLAWWRALEREGHGWRVVAPALVLLWTGLAVAIGQEGVVWHEVWASLLIALSVALREPGRWRRSVCFALLALLVRELALPYLVIAGALAWAEGARREALAWAAAIAAAALLFLLHAHLAGQHLFPGDPSSQGWMRVGGWPFVLATARWNALANAAPAALIAILVPASLFGLLAWRGPTGARLFLTAGTYVAAFAIFGRPDNHYWGLIDAPLLPLGLAFAGAGLRNLVRAAWPEQDPAQAAPT